MAQKIIVGILFLTIIGSGIVGVYDATRTSASEAPVDTIAAVEVDTTQNEMTAAATPQNTAEDSLAVIPMETSLQQQQSQNMVGDPWSAAGIITALDDFGMTLELEDAESLYVELGPPTYWQAQGIELAVQEQVTVDGFDNGDQVHAAIVTKADGTQLALRQETGQPLWAGNSGSGSGNNSSTEATMVVAPDEWETLTGTVISITNGNLSLQTDDNLVSAKLGQPSFWQSQGVTLTAGDAIDIVGFWQNDEFQVGDIIKLATNERIMLRDPNGRQLWGGPGRNGNSGQSQGQGQGQGNGKSGNSGQGNGYRGGQN